MKKLLSILFFVSIVIGSCKKEPPPELPLGWDYVHQDLVAYTQFKTGTYWIYRDSLSGLEDSVYCYVDTSFMYHQTGCVQKDGDYMFYNCQFHSYLDGYDYYNKISEGNYSITNGQLATVRVKYKPGDYAGETFIMSNCFRQGNQATWYLGAGTVYYKAFYEAYAGIVDSFPKVVKFYDTENRTEFSSPTNFYISKNFGIIRKEILDSNKVWDLVRYHILQ